MPNSLASPNPWLLQIKGRQHAGQEIATGRKKQLHKDRDVHFLLREWLFLEASSSSDKSQTKMSTAAEKIIWRTEGTMKSKIAFKHPSFPDSLHFSTVCFTLHFAASVSPQFSDLFIFFVSYTGHCSNLRPHKLLKRKLLRIKRVFTQHFYCEHSLCWWGKNPNHIKIPAVHN